MKSSDIKTRIHNYIDQADDRMLQIFNAIIDSESIEYDISKEEKKILDSRLQQHLENPEEGKLWTEVRSLLKVKYGV